jgi:hypothetical protein
MGYSEQLSPVISCLPILRSTLYDLHFSRANYIYSARLIEPFQRGETPTFTAHVQAGLRALAEDPNGLLVFSG